MWRVVGVIAVMLLLVSLLPAEGLHLEKTIALPAAVVSGITKDSQDPAGRRRCARQNLTSA